MHSVMVATLRGIETKLSELDQIASKVLSILMIL